MNQCMRVWLFHVDDDDDDGNFMFLNYPLHSTLYIKLWSDYILNVIYTLFVFSSTIDDNNNNNNEL